MRDLLLVLLPLLVAGVGTDAAWAQEVALVEVAVPAIDAMEPGARARIASARLRVRELQERGGELARRDLAVAFDDLGRLYLAFELFDAASSAFENVVRLDPSRASAQYFLGVCLAARGDLRAAAESFGAFLEGERTSAERAAALVRRGRVALELDDLELAESSFEGALAEDPDHAGALFGRGQVAAARGAHEKAVADFQRVLAAQPSASEVQYPLGQAYRRLGQRDAAREHLGLRGDGLVAFPDPLAREIASLAVAGAFEAVASLAAIGDAFDEQAYLGFVLAQFGALESAVEPLREALAERAREASGLTGDEAAREKLARARIHYGLGGLLVKHGRDTEARAELERALELEPSLRDARVKLGNLLVRAGDPMSAEREFTRVLEAHPDAVEVRVKRGALRMAAGRLEEARVDLEQAQAAAPDDPEILLRLGRVREGLGDLAGARRLYERGAELGFEARETAAMHYELAALDQRGGEAEAALQRYDLALAADPQLHAARFDRATLLGRLGRFREAAAGYADLLELDPRHEKAYLGRATALAVLGDAQAAAASLEEGARVLPQSLVLAHALARLLASTPDAAVRDGERAAALAQGVVQAAPAPEHVETLAMALAAAGRFEDAAAVQERLVEQLREVASAADVRRLEALLQGYQNGRACCFPEDSR